MTTDKQPRRFKLNTTINKYNVGDEVTEQEIKEFLNIRPCIDCGWLVEVKEQPLKVISLINTCADADNVTYELKLSKMLPPNSGHRVSQAIGSVLNEELDKDIVTVFFDTKLDLQTNVEVFTRVMNHYYPPKKPPTDTPLQDKEQEIEGLKRQIDNWINCHSTLSESYQRVCNELRNLKKEHNQIPLSEVQRTFRTYPTITKEQEQKKKDWEIVSLRYKKDGKVYPFTTVDYENFDINSIRRKSDGKIFAIGDKLNYVGTAKDVLYTVINFFSIVNNIIYINSDYVHTPDWRIGTWLHYSENELHPTPPATVVKDKVVTNNDDVQCLSLSQVIKIMGCRILDSQLEELKEKVTENLKQ